MENEISSEVPPIDSPNAADDAPWNPGSAGGGTDTRPPSPLDPSVLAEIRGLDDGGGLLRTAFGIFLTDGPRLLQDLQDALGHLDREAFIFAAHTLRSCAGSVGAVRVASASGALEHAARRGRPLGPSSALELVRQDLQEAAAEMARECGLPSVLPVEARE